MPRLLVNYQIARFAGLPVETRKFVSIGRFYAKTIHLRRKWFVWTVAVLRHRLWCGKCAQIVKDHFFNMKANDIIRFIGSDIHQVNWGGHDNPEGWLTVGRHYTVLAVDVHSSFTSIILKEFPSKRFNSVSFRQKDEED
jgi:hypothetical protein